jgi:hypothetical protein
MDHCKKSPEFESLKQKKSFKNAPQFEEFGERANASVQ